MRREFDVYISTQGNDVGFKSHPGNMPVIHFSHKSLESTEQCSHTSVYSYT